MECSQRQGRPDGRAAAGRARDLEPAPERRHAVRQFSCRTTLLSKDNAQHFLDSVVAAKADRDGNDSWVNVTGLIRY
jgi:hypothetical protein